MPEHEIKKAERCANTNPALNNPNSHERNVPMNMEQTVPNSNFAVLSGNNSTITMSSREIAELCGKRHDNVMTDISKMLSDIGLHAPDFSGTYKTAKGNTYDCFNLPKDLTVTLITGYRADLRYKVVKRLEQLEGQGAPTAIDVRNPGQLALIASQLIEVNQEQAKQIEAMQETVQAHDRLCESEGSLCITDAAKTLGIRRKDMFDWLHDKGWIFKRVESDDWVAYAPRLASGVMEHRVATYTRPDGTEKVVTQARVTPKGLSTLAKLITPTAKLIGGRAQ
ncbi:phage regulatory protein/antirepressor Ant [Paracoccus sp. SM22M-07]|uniref:phage antirepressor KilAC domain-containing protein n=1 Tax=Paracoccus sp. SM22M-07 TaxID=1520813 RepID=UPI00147FDE60|nr:phage regulatory protein/antirepressor Ant [Paracoccus sp. SM22M-07]